LYIKFTSQKLYHKIDVHLPVYIVVNWNVNSWLVLPQFIFWCCVPIWL